MEAKARGVYSGGSVEKVMVECGEGHGEVWEGWRLRGMEIVWGHLWDELET